MRHSFRILALGSLAALASMGTGLAGCSPSGGTHTPLPGEGREADQTDFVSSTPPGQAGGGGAGEASGASDSAATPAAPGAGKATTTERKVEETDLYRLEGDRLYYLNAYRGLMVFDVSNVDQPKLLGRSSIFGSPVEMIVRDGIATVVVGDWYGRDANGKPFHGSVVRTFDATNPSAIAVLGDAPLLGWVQDTRVVGDVLYAVSQDYGWYYGYDADVVATDGVATTASPAGPKVAISSVRFGKSAPVGVASKSYDGYSAAFHVTASSIVLAHDIPLDPKQPWGQSSGKTRLDLIDIRDPNGAITIEGGADVSGSFQGWGTDNGRWNVDFADERYARVLTCAAGAQNGYSYCGAQGSSYLLSTVDFQTAASPVLASSLAIPNPGWSVAARFDANRLYLSPGSDYWSGQTATTPVEIFDLADATAPKLSGSVDIPGQVWNFTPMGTKIFALGADYGGGGQGNDGSKVAVRYIDATDAANPTLLGSATFGQGWAWTPAAGTFKAFTLDTTKNLVVLPFSGWSNDSFTYNNGLQLISFTESSIQTAGASQSRGWVERGIFVKNRLVSLSDLALSVVDYTNPSAPKTVAELALAHNVVSAQPLGPTIAQLSTDWWGYDKRQTELRVLSTSNAEENTTLDAALQTVSIDGSDAQIFRNGNFAYVVSTLYDETGNAYANGTATQQVQIVDLGSGKAVLKGKLTLPKDPSYGYGFYGGCYWYDWWAGAEIVQVQGDALAFRRTHYTYDAATQTNKSDQTLYVVDLANVDAPSLSGTLITEKDDYWWGNMRAVGDTLYTTHYEWVTYPQWDQATGAQIVQGKVKYYLDRIDLSNRLAPRATSRINVPGILVGASETDASLLYFVDYRWFGDQQKDEVSVARVQNDKAHLLSTTPIDGYTGNVFVRGNKAYFSAQQYSYGMGVATSAKLRLHALDLSDPKHPVDGASADQKGWGWLLGVEGDRAIVSSGWGDVGVDVYKLGENQAPVFDKFVRTRGWGAYAMARQDDTLFLSSGYWGVQAVDLK